MSGESKLSTLLSTMAPVLIEGDLVFCSVTPERRLNLEINSLLEFKEQEGMTLILLEAEARLNGLTFAYPCRMITLNVHSSLEAVGFLAAISSELAQAGISVNAVSAFYHDHLFVPRAQAQLAIQVLRDLAKSAGA